MPIKSKSKEILPNMLKKIIGSVLVENVCPKIENSIYTSKNSCLEYNKVGQGMKGKL